MKVESTTFAARTGSELLGYLIPSSEVENDLLQEEPWEPPPGSGHAHGRFQDFSGLLGQSPMIFVNVDSGWKTILIRNQPGFSSASPEEFCQTILLDLSRRAPRATFDGPTRTKHGQDPIEILGARI